METHETRTPGALHDETRSEIAAGVSVGEVLGGLSVVVLAILGLAGIYPLWLAAIAAIVLGASLLCAGGEMMARFSRLLQASAGGHHEIEMSGTSAEFLGGAAGIVLGILALIGFAAPVPWTLLAVAAIVFGATLLLGAGALARLNSAAWASRFAAHDATRHDVTRQVASEMVSASSGASLLVGLAAIVLGILALTNVVPITLTLIAFLCLGAAVVMNGTAVSSKMLSFMGIR
jgi:hypothetical protein